MVRKTGFGLAAVAGLAAVVAVSAACGGSGNGGAASHGMDPAMTPPAAPQADVVVGLVVQDLRYAPSTIAVRAGQTAQINMRNMDAMEHDFQVDGLRVMKMSDTRMSGHHAGASAEMLAMHTVPNGSASMTFRTEQTGTFAFYCTIAGHRTAGMAGTLTVS